jgi:hypothetical protein
MGSTWICDSAEWNTTIFPPALNRLNNARHQSKASSRLEYDNLVL